MADAAAGGCLRTIRLPDCGDRTFWEQLPSSYREQLQRDGEAALEKDWPEIVLSDYMDFSRTGNRARYEEKFFVRLRMVDALVLAEACEDKGRFLPKALDGLWLLLEQTSWCLPAHNSDVRDAPQYPVPRDRRPVLDLFAAETGASVALAEQILRPKLAEISPFLSEYVNTELRRRIFTPYLTRHFWWMGDGKSKMLNWTPWITGNVLLAALTREKLLADDCRAKEKSKGEADGEPQAKEILTAGEREQILQRAVRSLDFFLDEYGEDGCCDEGAQYYSHAALCLYTALSLLERGLEDPQRIRHLYQNPLIRNMADYIVHVHVQGSYYINFADCSPLAGRRTAGEYCFGRACGLPQLAALAAEDFRREPYKERTLPDEISLFQRLRQAAMAGKMLEESGQCVDSNVPDVYYESCGLLIARDRHFVLAVKAGDNGDSHNHNDVGSFTLYRDGRPFFIDLGVETYTAKTFSKERYSIWTMQSQYHNLPTFRKSNGQQVQQLAGEAYRAGKVSCSLQEKEKTPGKERQNPAESGGMVRMRMDLAGAYPDGCAASYKRAMCFEKGSRIVIEDRAEGLAVGEYAELSLMTCEKPNPVRALEEKESGGTWKIDLGSCGSFRMEGAENIICEEIPIQDARLKEMWQNRVYRMRIRPKENWLRLVISETIAAGDSAEGDVTNSQQASRCENAK